MTPRKKLTAAAAGVLVAAALGGAAIVQASGDDSEGKATGAQAGQAKAAALKVTSGGTVNAVERDGEKGATWEVEVTRRDGKSVDVRRGAAYELVVVDSDGEDAGGR